MSLESEFTVALIHTIEVARQHKYTPTYFMQMLEEHGGVGTAKRLLAKTGTQSGLFQLYELHLLHESMEAVVLQDRFRSLFTDAEITEARHRLEELNYFNP